MEIDRRQLFSKGLTAGSAGLGAGLLGAQTMMGTAQAGFSLPSHGIMAETLGIKAHSRLDQTKALQHAIYKASSAQMPLILPAGRIRTQQLTLPDHCHLIGIPDNTEISFQGGNSLLRCHGAQTLHLHGISFIGNKLHTKTAILDMSKVKKLIISECSISQGSKNGLSLVGCSGTISRTVIHTIRETGLFCLDSHGLEISQNHIHHCQDNGIQVWRNIKGHDGTMVMSNRIEHISARSGGTGQNGNGINIYRAGNVMVSNNHISDCTFSAVRDNSGDNCQITNNHCSKLGEVALYAEFAFEGAVISNNLVDGAGTGISVTNFKQGGRLATVSGNLVRNVKARGKNQDYGTGIYVEADSMVSGNVIEDCRYNGIQVGWGSYVRDIIVSSNLVRLCPVGIGITDNSSGGYLTISGNMISNFKKGAIRAMNHNQYTGPDLSRKSAKNYHNFAIFNNVARG